MLKFLFFLFAFFSVLSSEAQFNLSGKVTDQEDKNLPFITIKISDVKNQINYTQTDSFGFYHFNNLQAGKYAITYAALNFNAENRLLTLSSDTLINIQLQENPNKLTDVQINVRKTLMEKQIDRTVFNVENSVSAIGTDALELLSKLPGVRVLNDRVSLVGRGSINIMINDKLVPLSDDELSNYLKSISSSSIAKIEVITNPPAKYDAQGNNGLINIVLKKVTAEGFRGSVNTIFSQATHPTASAGGNLSFRKNKITLSSNFNVRKGSLVPFEQSDVFYPKQT